jgi:hypothetical protein
MNQNNRNQRKFRQNSTKKKFKQVIYLRKPTKGKADAEKVNKQTRKTENQCNKNKAVKKF